MNIIEKYDKPFVYAGIIMNLIVAYQFYIVWSQPNLSDVAKISSLSALMAFEFIMVHSGVLMAVVPKKTSLHLLFPLYGLFALAFTTITESSQILILYLFVVFNRMRFAFSDVSPEKRKRVILNSILAAVIYFILLFVMIFGNGIFGELGLNQEFLNSTTYYNTTRLSGVFTQKPHIPIATGVFYYTILALIEALLLNINFSRKTVLFG